MARVFTDGAEFGDLLFWTLTGAGDSASTAQARSGLYSYLVSGSAALTKNITALTEFYFRVAVFTSNNNGSTTNLQWRNSTTVMGGIRFTGGVLQAYVGGTLVGTGTVSIQNNTWYLIEAHVKIADAGGIIEVKVDGVQDITFSGDTKPSTQTNVDNLYFTSQIGVNFHFDDLALNDTTGGADNSWCGDGHVIALVPNAAGDVTQLTPSTGSNYTCVDEVPSNGDTDYVESSTVDQYDLYNLAACGLSNPTISRVWIEARARDTVAAGAGLQLGIKTGGTEYWSSTLNLLTTYARLVSADWLTNPQSSAAWTAANLDALQAGAKVK